MNWLAHLFLSQPNGEHRLGNLLGDLVKGNRRQELSDRFSDGIKCHLLIDSFTDRHLIVRRSKRRISSQHRRYSGVLIDVFYDHLLARNWHIYSQVCLASFTEDVYNSFLEYWEEIPLFPRMIILRMIQEDWLGSYYNIAGIEATLSRIKGRLAAKYRNSFMVNYFLTELTDNYVELEKDFKEFFPIIISYLSN